MLKKFRYCLTLLLLSTTMFPFVTSYAQGSSDTYTVQSGDSMWKIAVKYQVGMQDIIEANKDVADPRLIYPGEKLTIPLFSAQKSVEAQVAALVNQQRAKVGLKPLKLNWQLSRIARIKSTDMMNNNYFSHQSPTYGSPFDMIKKFGLTYHYAGENIAAGQKDAQAVMQAWMNSSGHRANILNANFTEIGVGVSYGGKMGVYWTQQFIQP